MVKYHNYKHFKIPITINPLEYGKLIVKIEDLNLFIVQVNRTNVRKIYQYKDLNQIELYHEGDLVFKYKDHIIDDSTFVRSLENKKFTFKDKKLFSKENIVTPD